MAIEDSKTVLVVEDNSALRDLLCERLEMEGFEVFAAATLREARQLLASPGRPFAFALVDYLLPDGIGLELKKHIPTNSFLLVSGTIFEDGPPPDVAFLAKPFLLSDLVIRLRGILADTSVSVA